MENFSRVTFSVVLTKTKISDISDMRPGLEFPRLRVWIFERSVKPRGPAGSRSNPAGRARLSIGRFRSSRLGWLPQNHGFQLPLRHRSGVYGSPAPKADSDRSPK